MEFPFPIERRNYKITSSAIFHSFLLIFRLLSDETCTSSFLSQALWEWISVGGTNNNSRELWKQYHIKVPQHLWRYILCQISFIIVAPLRTTSKTGPRGASPVTAPAHLSLSSKYCSAFETCGWPKLAEFRGTRTTSNLTNVGLTEKTDSLLWTLE